MKVLVVLVCLSVGCLAQKPQPCSSPPQLTGNFSVSTSDEQLGVFGHYTYDALGKRLRLKEIGSYRSKPFYHDVLLLYTERVLYDINDKKQTCTKKRLNAHLHPLAIPKGATLLGRALLGTSSQPGLGLQVNTWVGQVHTNGTGKYSCTVTEIQCIPITTLFRTHRHGWMATHFFDNILEIRDPEQLSPPDFCKDAQLEEGDGEDLDTFFRLFEY